MITLAQLPAPPQGRTGWPWTEAPMPPQSGAYKSITVITPSFNQGEYLEETIRSILLQGYPSLEYIVMDGGSTDGSTAIIERYSDWITYWCSEKDGGQADALARGLDRVTGEVVNWINSDDTLLPGALHTVNRMMSDADIVAGICINVSSDGVEEPIKSMNLDAVALMSGSSAAVFHQPAVWLKRAAVAAAGGIDASLHYVFDWELLIRILARGARVAYTDEALAKFRLHAESKTVKASVAFELERRRATRLLVRSLPPGNARDAAVSLAERQRWWRLLATLQRRHGHTPGTAARILRAALRRPRIRLSRLTLGSVRRALFGSKT